jgi:hypothetical protein
MAPAGPWLRLMPSSPAASVPFDAVVLAMPDAGAERVAKDAAAVFVADALAHPRSSAARLGAQKPYSESGDGVTARDGSASVQPFVAAASKRPILGREAAIRPNK